MVIPCLYLLLLTVLHTPSAELPVNKKRTRTLFHKESGSSTNCMVGLTSPERIRRNSLLFKAVCIPGYIGYVLVCVYGINGAKGFVQGFWQLLVILSVMNLMDRLLVDGYWVGHTNVWTIPGTEDLKPYITAKDKQKKWLFGTVGMAVIAAVLAAIMTIFLY